MRAEWKRACCECRQNYRPNFLFRALSLVVVNLFFFFSNRLLLLKLTSVSIIVVSYQSARGRHTVVSSLKATEGTEWAGPMSTPQFVHWGIRKLANAIAFNQTAKQTQPARPTTSTSSRTLAFFTACLSWGRHFPLMSYDSFFGYFCWSCNTNMDLCHVGRSLPQTVFGQMLEFAVPYPITDLRGQKSAHLPSVSKEIIIKLVLIWCNKVVFKMGAARSQQEPPENV